MNLDSEQESKVYMFMQRSFGSTSIYVPEKIQRGKNGSNEPADLAWFDGENLALFYLNESISSIEKQIEHNKRQADGYFRLWSKLDDRYTLVAKNIFNETINIPFGGYNSLIQFLVISEQYGVKFIRHSKLNRNVLQIVIPDSLFSWVSDFGGTVVDLLAIVWNYSELHDVYDDNLAKYNHEELKIIMHEYVSNSIAKSNTSSQHGASADLQVIHNFITELRIQSWFNGGQNSAEARRQLGSIFSDMRLVETLMLLKLCTGVIEASNPPNFTSWNVGKTVDMFHNFLAITTNLDSPKCCEQVGEFIKSYGEMSGGKLCETVLIFQSGLGGGIEYRIPLLALSSTGKNKQSSVLCNGIIDINDQSTKHQSSNRIIF